MNVFRWQGHPEQEFSIDVSAFLSIFLNVFIIKQKTVKKNFHFLMIKGNLIYFCIKFKLNNYEEIFTNY